ncbi:unnamed protein product, partial [Vitis vinifera]
MEIALEWKRKKPHDWQDFVGIITLLFKNSTGSFIKENNVGEGCWVLMALCTYSAQTLWWVNPGLAKLIHFKGLIGGLAAKTSFHLWVLFEMVYFHSSISGCNSVDQSGIMESYLNYGEAFSANECFEFPPDVVKLISGIMMFPLSLRHANNYAATHGRMKPPSKH